MGTMYRSPEEIAFYAKLKADRAAAPKVEAPVYVAPKVDPRVALMPARFADCEEQAAWCAEHGVAVVDPNCYEVRNFGTGFRASVAMEAALRVAAVAPAAPVVPGAPLLPTAPTNGVLDGTGAAPTVGKILEFRDGTYVVTAVTTFRINEDTASSRGSYFLGREGGRGFAATIKITNEGN